MGLAVSYFSGYVRLAVSFFIQRCLGVSIFCKTEGISEKKSILTSPKLSEFQKKLENLPQHYLAPEKSSYSVVLEYNSGISSSSQYTEAGQKAKRS